MIFIQTRRLMKIARMGILKTVVEPNISGGENSYKCRNGQYKRHQRDCEISYPFINVSLRTSHQPQRQHLERWPKSSRQENKTV